MAKDISIFIVLLFTLIGLFLASDPFVQGILLGLITGLLICILDKLDKIYKLQQKIYEKK